MINVQDARQYLKIKMTEETWYEELGFEENPFSMKPRATDMIGQEKTNQEILDKIDAGQILLLKGNYGSGKTTTLKTIINDYLGEGKIIYYSCNTTEKTIPFNNLLVGRNTFLKRLINLKARDAILLLDEAQDLKPGEMEKIVDLYDQGYFKSIVLVSKKEVLLTEDLRDLVEENNYKLGELTPTQAVELIQERLEGHEILDEEMTQAIYDLDRNPRALLANCEDSCRNAVVNGREKVNFDDVKSLNSPEVIKPTINKPTDKSSKEEIENYLINSEIEYSKKSSKKELLALFN
jgi:type II secretory pathway predicted ATPase ExeA